MPYKVSLYDAGGKKIAIIDDDMKVRDLQNRIIGSVRENGEVYDPTGNKAGHLSERDGYIYDETKRIGRVDAYGAVYDYEGTRVGKVMGGHIKLGGAALLLLVR